MSDEKGSVEDAVKVIKKMGLDRGDMWRLMDWCYLTAEVMEEEEKEEKK